MGLAGENSSTRTQHFLNFKYNKYIIATRIFKYINVYQVIYSSSSVIVYIVMYINTDKHWLAMIKSSNNIIIIKSASSFNHIEWKI